MRRRVPRVPQAHGEAPIPARGARSRGAIGNLRSNVDRFNGRYALRYVPFDKVRFERKALLTEADILDCFPLLPRP